MIIFWSAVSFFAGIVFGIIIMAVMVASANDERGRK